jgi:hypothetical protein
MYAKGSKIMIKIQAPKKINICADFTNKCVELADKCVNKF